MIVVADTSPISYLVEIECIWLLGAIYKRVLVPETVLIELSHAGAPPSVTEWISPRPAWLEICNASLKADSELENLDPGERDAILLAQERTADLLLIDEQRGRLAARKRGLLTTGTLGVLLTAHNADLIDAKQAYMRLKQETTFRYTPELENAFFRRLKPISSSQK